MRSHAGKSALVLASAALLAACSSVPPTPQPTGDQLTTGTAVVSIGGAEVATSHDVQCTSAGAVTTIVTGADRTGTTSAVDSDGGLAAQYVEIRDVDGFTGSYWHGLGAAPEVELTGRTFVVTGTATGYHVNDPSARVEERYRIRVAC
jgi:ipoprotein LpqH